MMEKFLSAVVLAFYVLVPLYIFVYAAKMFWKSIRNRDSIFKATGAWLNRMVEIVLGLGS